MDVIVPMPTSLEIQAQNVNDLLTKIYYYNVNNVDRIVLDFSGTTWFSAEMSTLLSVIIRDLQAQGKSVATKGLKPTVNEFLKKNNFLPSFGIGEKLPDNNGTIIPFVEFQSEATKQINDYLDNQAFSIMDKKITSVQNEIIKSAIYEITHNIFEHSQSNFFYMCGQFFPRKNRLAFTISDKGITIPKNIKNKSNIRLSTSSDYIDWATLEGKSTKKGASGLGLFELKTNMKQLGRLVIISNKGFNSYSVDGTIKKELNNPFNGTMIYLDYDLDRNLTTTLDNINNLLF